MKGLNALIATLCTPIGAPVIAAARLRKGSTNSARGATRLLADALATAHRAGAGGLVIVSADSAYYTHDLIAAAGRSGAQFSVTARMNPAVARAISGIADSACTPIHYPNVVYDDGEGWLISDAEVAEIPYTAFTSRRRDQHVTARLIERRVRRLNPASPRSRARRVVPGLPLPPGIHRLTTADARHRGQPPRPTTAATRLSNKSSPT